jgi:NAD-dependent dihydropyrimidine dehydrogenase PreA subunit
MATNKTNCKTEAEKWMPVINLSKCEGKKDCVEVCPYDVFQMQEITSEAYKMLTFTGKIKTMVHGRKKAFAKHAEACHACGLCITACPEKAIKLVKSIF